MKRIHTISGLITVISLFLGVIWLSPSVAGAAPTFASLGQIKAEGLNVPGAMDLDDAGNLYVADARGERVHKFSPYGKLLSSWQVQATGRGLAVTPDGGRLYVSRQHDVVFVNAANGEVLGLFDGAEANGTEFGVAGEIDLDASGNVFVADTGSMQIKVYDKDGQYRTRFGGPGTTAGLFVQIGGMAVNKAGQVVVADSSAVNAKVHVFTLNSSLQVVLPVATYATQSSASVGYFGSPYLYTPRGLAFDGQGRGYFLEFESSQVRLTSESFVFQGAYAVKGYGVGELNNVTDAIFDKVNGRLFVGCDDGRIEILGVDGGKNPEANSAPTTPGTQSPRAGSEVASLRPVLVIDNSTDKDGDALTYTVKVYRDGDVVYDEKVPAAAGETTSVTVGKYLAENQAYTWTVQAFDGKEYSAVSAAANFVVNAEEQAPSVPGLIAPKDGESINGFDLLTWGASTDPDPNDLEVSYRVEVAADELFAKVVAAKELSDTALALGSFSTYDELQLGAGYFWRVTAIGSDQVNSAPSTAGRFVYDTTALTITANMPGAVVSFHGNQAYAGQAIGVAPLRLRDFTPGVYSVVVERPGFVPYVSQVTVVEGKGSHVYAELVPALDIQSLQNGTTISTGSVAVNASAAPFLVDFDNDGVLDLLVGYASGQFELYTNLRLQRSGLTVSRKGSLGLPVMPGAVPFVADWNNDGRKDLLVGLADGSVRLFLNVGQEASPAFAAGVDVQTVNGALDAGNNAAPVVIDFNGDKAKDLVVGNAAGQVLVYLNQGTDALPLLAAPEVAVTVAAGVVPASVDWDADGKRDLLLTYDGSSVVYPQVGGKLIAGAELLKKSKSFAGFPVDLDETGKVMVAGQNDGKLILYATADKAPALVASFFAALQDKVDEVGALVAEDAPEQLSRVTNLGTLLDNGDYPEAVLAARKLVDALANGAAKNSAGELYRLLDSQWDAAIDSGDASSGTVSEPSRSPGRSSGSTSTTSGSVGEEPPTAGDSTGTSGQTTTGRTRSR